MPKRSHFIIIVVLIFFIECICCSRYCAAQLVKDAGEIEQNRFMTGNDIEFYQVLYKPDDKAYADYCKLIREKIRQSIENKRLRYFAKGDVGLQFILSSDGALVKFGIDNERSTKDKGLINIAASSLKNASPFPPFPEDISASEMPFDIVISFRER